MVALKRDGPKFRRLQEATKSRDNVAMGTGGRTAVVPRQRRVTGCGCYGDGRKHPPAFKMAPNHVVKVAMVKYRPDCKKAARHGMALLWGRAEKPP